MYFEFVKSARLSGNGNAPFKVADELYKCCANAERNCRINPDETMIAIRQAIEVLTAGIINTFGGTEFGELFKMIDECNFICRKDFNDEVKKILHQLRKDANKYVHVEKKGKSLDANTYTIRGLHATIKDSTSATIQLYIALSKCFHEKGEFLKIEFLPIGDYEIIKTVKTEVYDAVKGDLVYFAEKKGSLVSSYVYIRPFSNVKDDENSVFNERDIAIQDVFKNLPHSDYVISGEEIPVSMHCDIRYIKYNIIKDTTTLNQAYKSLGKADCLKVVMDVACGLADIMAGGVNIHHRSIKPNCIFVDQQSNGWRGRIGCFETAKVEIKEQVIETVHFNMLKANKGNIFTHPILGELTDVEGLYWEKGDVYSLAVILLYCFDAAGVNAGVLDTSIIYEEFSTEFASVMSDILETGSLEMVPTMKEFYLAIKTELENGDY